MYTILGILAAVGGVLAYIYNLITKNAALKQIIQSQKVKEQMQEWADKIQAIEDKVKVDERDYQDAKDTFNRNNSGDDSGSKS